MADLTSQKQLNLRSEQVVFKYYFQWQFAEKSWSEMNLWMRLPCHANIVSFNCVVVDELEGRVIGFTNDYVPGGTLEENGSRVFQLEWLRQLIRLVDDVNLEYGIAHQDIAPRNLLVDEQTNSIMLFDFNFAARINHPPSEGERYQEERNDVKGLIFTVYEIITRDDSLRSVPHEEQDSNILTLEWVRHPEVKLDHPITKYKTMLHEWQEQRATDLGRVNSGKAPKAIDWPSRPRPPLKTISATDMQGQPVSFTDEEWFKRRQDVRERGGQALDWERPPQERLDEKTRMLSTGKPVTCHT